MDGASAPPHLQALQGINKLECVEYKWRPQMFHKDIESIIFKFVFVHLIPFLDSYICCFIHC